MERPEQVRTDAEINPFGGRRRFPVPWGLLIALGVYAAAVTGYVAVSYWRSPDYQASAHYMRAWDILGRDGGRRASQAKLVEAYGELLEAALAKPEVKTLHDDLESLNWRFEERHLKLPPELRRRAEAVAMLWQRIQESHEPILAVGRHERGWEPEELLGGPARAAAWSLVGVVLILLVWGYGRYSEGAVRAKEKEEYLRGVEEEVAARDRERRPPRR